MNTFSANATGTQQVARDLVGQRVHDAELRRTARRIRAEQRAERRARARAARAVPVSQAVPTAAFRFLHPIH